MCKLLRCFLVERGHALFLPFLPFFLSGWDVDMVARAGTVTLDIEMLWAK